MRSASKEWLYGSEWDVGSDEYQLMNSIRNSRNAQYHMVMDGERFGKKETFTLRHEFVHAFAAFRLL